MLVQSATSQVTPDHRAGAPACGAPGPRGRPALAFETDTRDGAAVLAMTGQLVAETVVTAEAKILTTTVLAGRPLNLVLDLTGIDAIEWAGRGEELGAGEILLNSMDADGTKAGFDLEMLRAVRKVVRVPVIASGGAGAVEHFAPAVDAGADAVLAASVFHFGELTVGDVKASLRAAGHPVR